MRSANAYDVVVVGAGAVGLACAWRSAQRGLSVCVLERGKPGEGASRVAAGMLAPATEAYFGEEELLELNLCAADSYADVARELEDATGMDVGYARCGALYVGLDRDEAEELRRVHEFHRSLGLDSEWLLASECRRLEPGLTTACAGGLHAVCDGRVDPRRLTAALGRAAELAGAMLVGGAEVTGALLAGERLEGVSCADGSQFTAGHVVLAAGCWSGTAGWLPAEARPPVRPVKGQVVLLRGSVSVPVCERVVRTPGVYVVPRGDGTVVLGATVEEAGFDARVTAGGVHELLREGYRAVPEVAELELAETAAGVRPGTPDNRPFIGRGALDGLWLATGHYRNGILLAPVSGEAVAALVAGEEPAVSLAPFAPDRFGVRV